MNKNTKRTQVAPQSGLPQDANIHNGKLQPAKEASPSDGQKKSSVPKMPTTPQKTDANKNKKSHTYLMPWNIILLLLLCLSLQNCLEEPKSKSIDLEYQLDMAILEKAKRMGYYHAMAVQAEKQGRSDMALYIKDLAAEELEHLKKLATLAAVPRKNLKRSLKAALKTEQNTNKLKYPALGRLAQRMKNRELQDYVSELQAEEKLHILKLKGMLKKQL